MAFVAQKKNTFSYQYKKTEKFYALSHSIRTSFGSSYLLIRKLNSEQETSNLQKIVCFFHVVVFHKLKSVVSAHLQTQNKFSGTIMALLFNQRQQKRRWKKKESVKV